MTHFAARSLFRIITFSVREPRVYKRVEGEAPPPIISILSRDSIPREGRGGRTSKDILFQRSARGARSSCLIRRHEINKRMKGLGRELNRYHSESAD